MLVWCVVCWLKDLPEKYGKEPEKLFTPIFTCLKDVEAPMEIGMLPVSRTQILMPLLATFAWSGTFFSKCQHRHAHQDSLIQNLAAAQRSARRFDKS